MYLFYANAYRPGDCFPIDLDYDFPSNTITFAPRKTTVQKCVRDIRSPFYPWKVKGRKALASCLYSVMDKTYGLIRRLEA